MPRTNVDEVLNDFRNAQIRINYDKYNPNSDDFMTALHLGMMWLVMKECRDTHELHDEDDIESNIEEEMHDAKKYWKLYLDTNDEMYKKMANEELNHAKMLIGKVCELPEDEEKKVKTKNYEDEYKKLKLDEI